MKPQSRIHSIGVKLPNQKVSSQSITDNMSLTPPLKLELISGIKERRFCVEDDDTFGLAMGAAIDCLKYSIYNAADIEMIIFCGISKLDSDLTYYYEPSVSSYIAKELCTRNVISFDIQNACAGMVTGIHIANNYIEQKIVRNCLVVSGEYISSICNNAVKNITSHSSDELASLTLGDAGAAVLLEKASEEDSFEVLSLKTFSQHSRHCIAKLSNKYKGAQMFTQMQKLFKASIKESPDFLENSLNEAGLSYGDIDYLIPHQTAKRAINSGAASYRKRFSCEPKHIVNNIELMGNTASTTHFLALYRLLKENKLKKHDRILLLSFASGLVVGVVVTKINDLIERYSK